jgi:hypothetical protein
LSILPLGCADTDEDDGSGPDGSFYIIQGPELATLQVLEQQVAEPGFVEGRLARSNQRDLGKVIVCANNVPPQLGEA